MPQKDTINFSRSVVPANSLAVLGIDAFEEAVYRALLRAPGSTVDELAAQLGETAAAVGVATCELERKGFATHAPERVHRLFPSPPDIAIESLLLHRQMELQTARQAITELQQEGRSGGDSAPVVEIIDADPAAKIQPYLQSHRGAKHEVLCLVRPPFVVSSPDKIEEERGEARKRGVRYRNIVHPDVLAMPG
jgi:sugar-specific transcriptional regulator TrmB